MTEALLLIAGAIVGLASTLVADQLRRKARKVDEAAEMYRRAVADFVSKATAARYEFEHLVGGRLDGRYSVNGMGVPKSLTAADLECGFAYHMLTLVVDADTVVLARDLRRHLEQMKRWATGTFDALSDDELTKRVEEAWHLRDLCVSHARTSLGLISLADEDGAEADEDLTEGGSGRTTATGGSQAARA